MMRMKTFAGFVVGVVLVLSLGSAIASLPTNSFGNGVWPFSVNDLGLWKRTKTKAYRVNASSTAASQDFGDTVKVISYANEGSDEVRVNHDPSSLTPTATSGFPVSAGQKWDGIEFQTTAVNFIRSGSADVSLTIYVEYD